MNMEKGSILDIKKGIICHQVNCEGIMGVGLSKKIKEQYPDSYVDYMGAWMMGDLVVGNVIFSVIEDKRLYVAHVCGQHKEDKRSNINRNTSYVGLINCFKSISSFSDKLKLPVYVPFDLGSRSGGGESTSIMKVLTSNLSKATLLYDEDTEIV